MGSDDIFKKSRAKKHKSDKKRTKETKSELKKILIVSEGIKTEPIYFEFLVSKYKLKIADVRVTGASSSCPLNVVKFAEKEYQTSVSYGDAYDEVYCLFDKDTHANYKKALSYISELPSKVFFAINSVPCFEFWLLLHYIYTTKPFSAIQNKSICNALISRELKKYIPKYVKNISDLSEDELNYIFDDATIKQAISYSEKVIKHCQTGATDNPSTYIHLLVKELNNLYNIQEQILS